VQHLQGSCRRLLAARQLHAGQHIGQLAHKRLLRRCVGALQLEVQQQVLVCVDGAAVQIHVALRLVVNLRLRLHPRLQLIRVPDCVTPA
jgi:hypothetical protein